MTISLERYTEHHPRAADVVMVLTLFALALFGSQISTPESSPPEELWPARILAGVSAAAVLKSRSHPRAALIVTVAAAAVMTRLDYLPSPLLLAPVMAALYWLAALTDSRTTRVFGYTTMAVLMVTAVSAAPLGDLFLLRSVGTVFWLLLPLSTGSKSRLRRAYLESVQARAARRARTRWPGGAPGSTRERRRGGAPGSTRARGPRRAPGKTWARAGPGSSCDDPSPCCSWASSASAPSRSR